MIDTITGPAIVCLARVGMPSKSRPGHNGSSDSQYQLIAECLCTEHIHKTAM